MSFNDTYIRQFSDAAFLLAHQEESQLLRLFDVEVTNGVSEVFRRFGTIDLNPIAGGPLTDINPVQLDTDWRYVERVPYEADLFVTERDIDNLKMDPTGVMAKRMAQAIASKSDAIIINATVGEAKTGLLGTGTPANITQTVAVNSHKYDNGSGDVGLSMSKLIEARTKIATYRKETVLNAKDYLVILNQKQAANLLADDKVTSRDFQIGSALSGQMVTPLGLNYILSEHLTIDSSDDELVVVCHRDAVKVSIPPHNRTIRLDYLPNKQGIVHNMKAIMEMGAVRMDEGLVVTIACDPT